MPDHNWIKLQAALMLTGTVGLYHGMALWVLLGLAAASFVLYLLTNRQRLLKHTPWGGYANLVTLARLALLLLAGSQFAKWHDYGLFAAFLVVVVSDGIDGYLARKYKQTTVLGSWLDIETDALLCLVLASVHYVQDTASAWVLLAGSLRYIYVWVLFAAGMEQIEAPSQPYARLVGILFISSLLGPFVAPLWLAIPVLALGCLLVGGSFLHSFYGKWRAKQAVNARH